MRAICADAQIWGILILLKGKGRRQTRTNAQIRWAPLCGRSLGLTQEELADLAGVSLPFVQDAELDKPSLQLDRLIALLNALGVHLELRVGAGDPVAT